MSRFVRASKYRHVFGQPSKREYGYENVKVTGSAWDTNIISSSGKYISVNWNASGGGAFAILPLISPFASVSNVPSKLPDVIPLARSHTAPVLDTDWSPHNDSVVASGGEDGKVNIWKVESSAFEDWGQDGWVPRDFEPVARIDASPRKIGQVSFHPTASNVLASASGEYTVKLWDLANVESAKITLAGHTDAVQSLAFNPTGTMLATTSRDRKIRLFDPRAGGEAVRIAEGHGGIKGSRVIWMGDLDKIATTGFSKMSDRQVGVWDVGSLNSVRNLNVDQSSGVIMPFWSDNGILFLAGKGDGNIRYYEWESDSLFALSEHKSTDPQRGMCFLPRRALSVAECEIARAYKVYGSMIEPIAFIVPRKADSFQSDIFPPAPSSEPSLSASEFFSGKNAPQNLVNLDTGTTFPASQSSGAFSSAPAPPPLASATYSSTPTPQSMTAPTPTRTLTAPPPAEEASPVASATFKMSEPTYEPAAEIRLPPSRQQSTGAGDAALREENARLTAELREMREKVRNLELQVESIKANAKKAMALLDA